MPLYRFDAFELDVGLYRLSRAGEPIAIGPKPFDLLLYLIRNSQRTIHKAELIREVWQAEAVSDSSIPTCITAVRRALGDDRVITALPDPDGMVTKARQFGDGANPVAMVFLCSHTLICLYNVPTKFRHYIDT